LGVRHPRKKERQIGNLNPKSLILNPKNAGLENTHRDFTRRVGKTQVSEFRQICIFIIMKLKKSVQK